MLTLRIGYAVSGLALLMTAGCAGNPADDLPAAADGPALVTQHEKASTPEAVAELYAAVDDARAQRVTGPERAAEPLAVLGASELAATSGSSLRAPLPGKAARKVLNEDLNEGENLFFTDDGRLFVSGTEDIYEIKRAANGSFRKTDHFDEDCVVEGIVRSQNYLYGVCWTLQLDLSVRSFLLGGEITDDPVFRILGELEQDVVANGMTVDPQGRLYITYTTGMGQIVRLTFAAPLQIARKEIWASGLPNVNGIKYRAGAMYVTLLTDALMGQFARVPVLADGSAGQPEVLYERWLTVLDDTIPFEDGFIITDFLKGTLVFWDRVRGVYAETPAGTFYGPTALAQGRPPMFTERQLIVAEKGTFLIRDERLGDLLSMYQLP